MAIVHAEDAGQDPAAPAGMAGKGRQIPGGGDVGLTKSQKKQEKKNLARKRAREKKALAEAADGTAPGTGPSGVKENVNG